MIYFSLDFLASNTQFFITFCKPYCMMVNTQYNKLTSTLQFLQLVVNQNKGNIVLKD